MEERIVPVIFQVGVSPYQASEKAGFPPEQAHDLVRRGLATYANPEDAPEPVEEKPEPFIPEPLSLLEKMAGVTEEMKAEADAKEQAKRATPEPVEDAEPSDLLNAKPDAEEVPLPKARRRQRR